MTIRNLRTHDAPFMTVAELAAYVRLTTRTLYKEIAAGELRVKRVGPRGNIRIPLEEAQRYAGEAPYPPATPAQGKVSPARHPPSNR